MRQVSKQIGWEVRLFPHPRGHKVEADTPREWVANRKTCSWGDRGASLKKQIYPSAVC